MEAPLSLLAKKLKLRSGTRAAVVDAAPDYLSRLGPPEGTTVVGCPRRPASTGSRCSSGPPRSWPLSCRRSQAAIAPDGLVWIAYPKGSSKQQTDLTRDKGWESLEGSDLMWISLVSVDDTWSAFGLRPYKPGEARQTFR